MLQTATPTFQSNRVILCDKNVSAALQFCGSNYAMDTPVCFAAGHRKLVCGRARKGGCTLPETVASQWLDRNPSTHEAHGEELKTAAQILVGRKGAGGQHVCRILFNDSRPSLAGLSAGYVFKKQRVVGHETTPSAILNKTDPASCDKYRCI